MTHWGWYWHVKLKHKPKHLCSHYHSIDSFSLFKYKIGVQMSLGKVALEIPAYQLKATLLPDRFYVEYVGGHYEIPIEKQPCNYGGVRYFLHCPQCKRRMRLLYCKDGVFKCRKCLNLGYVTQVIRPSWRCIYMANKIKTVLENKAGSLERKPPWMKRWTFDAWQEKHYEYEHTKYREACRRERV